MNPYQHTPLGRPAAYPQRVEPGVLVPIARRAARADLGLDADAPLPFHGEDLWGCYELSWLDAHGKPVRAVAELRVPARSPCLVESKSLKLYLNGYAHERFDSAEAVRARVEGDLARVAGASVALALLPAAAWPALQLRPAPGSSLDALEIAINHYAAPDAGLLRAHGATPLRETLHSALFRSNCPVTGQPDWATVVVDYAGPGIDHAGLLAYLIGFRAHAAFHEQCVERIWLDLLRQCRCAELTVYACFTRRGGLDITPLRSTAPTARLPAWQRDPVQ